MAGYVSLFKFTPKGLAEIKSLPEFIKESSAELKKMGVRMVGFWLTMGEYDAIGIYDAPDDHTMTAALLGGLKHYGTFTTQTMRALSEDEIAQVLGKMP